MKEKLNKKNNINYIHYLQYTEVILLEKQINSSTIAYLLIFSASNITYQWSWPKIDTLLLRI